MFEGEGGRAGDHLRRRARRDRPLAQSGVPGFGGGNDEREQTLNQILTEMDGFDSSTGVIVVGATNRPESSTRRCCARAVSTGASSCRRPTGTVARRSCGVHARGVPLAPDVDLDRMASTTPGMVGADLANLVNEAALLAARRGHDQVEEADFTDALERIVLGAERKAMMIPDERRRTAYHEAGTRSSGC